MYSSISNKKIIFCQKQHDAQYNLNDKEIHIQGRAVKYTP